MKPPSTMPILKTTSPCLAKLDRLGWTAGLCVETYGLTLGVRVNREDFLPRVLERLPPGWKPCRSAEVDRLFSLWLGDADGRAGIRRYTLLYAGILRRARTFDVEEALQTLEAEMRQAVAAGRPALGLRARGGRGLPGASDPGAGTQRRGQEHARSPSSCAPAPPTIPTSSPCSTEGAACIRS